MNLSELESDTNVLPMGPGQMADEFLVSAAQSGDSYAFVELSQRYSRQLLLKTYRITNNWQDAEDVVQESLMSAFIHINNFESRARFSTWLTRIAINSALMLLRKRRKCPVATIDSAIYDEGPCELPEPRDHRDNPEQSYTRYQTEQRLKVAIQRIRPKYREVVELHQVNDLSLKEIAKSLCISVPAVKSRLLRARKELRQYVQ
ncbi:MAG: sigma-70 family RNA polymerase sigma factor [Terracidiphilus sp.]